MGNGWAFVECSILTRNNMKVADVVWGSEPFFEAHGYSTPYPVAPESCVGGVSPGSTADEMLLKGTLYLERGAQGFWFCNVSKQQGVLTNSAGTSQWARVTRLTWPV